MWRQTTDRSGRGGKRAREGRRLGRGQSTRHVGTRARGPRPTYQAVGAPQRQSGRQSRHESTPAECLRSSSRLGDSCGRLHGGRRVYRTRRYPDVASLRGFLCVTITPTLAGARWARTVRTEPSHPMTSLVVGHVLSMKGCGSLPTTLGAEVLPLPDRLPACLTPPRRHGPRMSLPPLPRRCIRLLNASTAQRPPHLRLPRTLRTQPQRPMLRCVSLDRRGQHGYE